MIHDNHDASKLGKLFFSLAKFRVEYFLHQGLMSIQTLPEAIIYLFDCDS